MRQIFEADDGRDQAYVSGFRTGLSVVRFSSKISYCGLSLFLLVSSWARVMAWDCLNVGDVLKIKINQERQ